MQHNGFRDRPVVARLAYAVGGGVAAVLAAVGLYTSGFGQFSPDIFRSLMVLGAAVVVVLTVPAKLPIPNRSYWWIVRVCLEVHLMVALLLASLRFMDVAAEIEGGIVILSGWDVAIGLVSVVALLELTRRVFGLPITIVSLIALLFVLFGNQLPGYFNHRGFPLDDVVTQLWYSFRGIFGLPTAVVLNFVLVFILFGSMLEASGAGERLMNLVFVVTGRTRGGPAHGAIAASGIFGTMSGSVTANVVGTGTVTIPIIIRRGFSPHFAGGVEAAASAGGQLMPPVMGASAFMIVELTGISYLYVAIGALVPALIYYGSLFASVAVEAKRRGLEPLPRSQRPKLSRTDLYLSVQFVAPVAVIIVLLVEGYSAAMAGFWATATVAVLAFLKANFRELPERFLQAFVNAGKGGAALLVAAGALGVIVGAMEKSGLGVKFANTILLMSETNLILALILTMMACLVLGMGMPTLPAYLIIIIIMGPAITKFGIPELAVHLFVLYFGILSNVTPPVAIAAYAAAPIARASPMRIAMAGLRLSFAGFLVPFFFVFNPGLILGSVPFEPAQFAWLLIRLVVAIWLLATALGGYDRCRLPLSSSAMRIGLAFIVLFGDRFLPENALVSTGAVVGSFVAACALYFHARIVASRMRTAAAG